jgi:predicted house-cleaning noncanonical NTP pyrophosphatase (MazG superfamily)
MDIRLAQKIAWGNKRANDINAADAQAESCLLSKEMAAAFDAWHQSRGAVSEELADVFIFLMALAEMVGTDLQEAVEAKFAVSAARATTGQGKLVRDKIPQIIRSKGQEPVVHTASAEEFSIHLRDKLREEVEEFLASDNDPEELADILEVLHALAGQAGIDQQQLERLRAAKAEKRGGFSDRIVWSGNRPVEVALDVSAPSTRSTANTELQRQPRQRKPATAG